MGIAEQNLFGTVAGLAAAEKQCLQAHLRCLRQAGL